MYVNTKLSMSKSPNSIYFYMGFFEWYVILYERYVIRMVRRVPDACPTRVRSVPGASGTRRARVGHALPVDSSVPVLYHLEDLRYAPVTRGGTARPTRLMMASIR